METRLSRIAAFLLLLCSYPSLTWAAPSGQAATPVPGKTASAPANTVSALDLARKTASELIGNGDAALKLNAIVDGLSPQDGLALLSEFAASVSDPLASKALLLRGGQLALLLGVFDEAASLLESAATRIGSSRDDALLLVSARSNLAAGLSEKARELAALVLSSGSQDLSAEARLVSAWSLLLDGDSPGALAMIGSPSGSQGRLEPDCETLFLTWVASPDSQRPVAAAALCKAFPMSPEAAIAGASDHPRGASPWAELETLPHWYLRGLLNGASNPNPEAAPPKPPPASQPPVPQPPASAGQGNGAVVKPPSSPEIRRFQVGIFADAKNASLLMAELAKKGFTAKIEKRRVGGKDLFAVVVEGEAESTILRLKDSGYETYPLF